MDTTLRPSWDVRFFEDFAVGDHFRHPLGRTINATDNAWFTLLTMNTNQLHFNDHYEFHSLTGEQIVNSGLTAAMILGISVVTSARTRSPTSAGPTSSSCTAATQT